jgi:hypothetical protein
MENKETAVATAKQENSLREVVIGSSSCVWGVRKRDAAPDFKLHATVRNDTTMRKNSVLLAARH